MTLKVDLVMFNGEGEPSSNLAVWKGDKPTPRQLEVLKNYVEQLEKGQDHEESEFI